MTSFVVSEMRSTKHSIVRTNTTITKSAPHGITLRSVCVRECVRMNHRFMVLVKCYNQGPEARCVYIRLQCF